VTDPFSGEGARLYGGGWNPKGIPVVYTASSRALAILEMLVQDQPLRARYAIIAARIPSTVRIEHVSAAALPDTWATAPPSDELRAIGADWITRAKTAVLRVPSTVVPSEFNYLLNPAHREFHRIKLGLVETLSTDRRLLQKLSNKARRKSRQTR
jgi:RES domain-containing protein